MADLAQQIKTVQDKLQQLLKRHATLQKENQQLKKDLEEATALTTEKEQSINTLKHQVNALQISTGNLSAAEKETLNKRIDGYLKEIDKCIAMLNA